MLDEPSVPGTYCGSGIPGRIRLKRIRFIRKACRYLRPGNYTVPRSHAIQIERGWFYLQTSSRRAMGWGRRFVV